MKSKKNKGNCLLCCRCGMVVTKDDSVRTTSGRMCFGCAAEIVENNRKATDMRKMKDNKTNVNKPGRNDENAQAKKVAERMEENRRGALLSAVWGSKKSSRLNQIIDNDYCGRLTVREFASIVLADRLNFPKGIDTPICIGDFEGNFCTNVLSVTVGGDSSDHVCIMGDPHGCME